MRRLGVDAYRFSVAWPRVIPDGVGRPNPAGIAFYDRLVDALLEAGIRPFTTLYHWDLPQVLQDKGGWPARDTAEAFAEYASVVAGALGDRVTDWNTINEPFCVAWVGHLEGRMAPGLEDVNAAVKASHHVLLGHGLATQAIRANAKAAPNIGIVLNVSPSDPATDSPEDLAAAVRGDGHTNRWWLDPLYGRGYPADMIEVYGAEPPVLDRDLATIATPTEFIGLNYYFRAVVTSDTEAKPPFTRQVEIPGATTTAMGWEVYPAGLERILVRIAGEYQPPKIYVTEQGSAWPDRVQPDGEVEDKERIDYLERHLEALNTASTEGVPLAGYFVWSLLDNLEWAYGYDKRFGLAYVDYATQKRTMKASGYRYAEILREFRAARA
jgi:beta-glucosidase